MYVIEYYLVICIEGKILYYDLFEVCWFDDLFLVVDCIVINYCIIIIGCIGYFNVLICGSDVGIN